MSGTTAIDTRAPELAVVDLPPHTVLQAGQIVSFNWSVSDDNPSLGAESNTAEMWLGEVLVESYPFGPGNGAHAWQWTVVDTTSGTAHLVVRTTDAFGNLTVDRGDDFTILSSATDVPNTGAPPVFAPPMPNPFNPQTELRFNLPSAGPVAVTVHDARGYRVATLLRASVAAGPLQLRWDGTDDTGRRMAGGTYFFRLSHGSPGQASRIVHKGVLLP